METETEIQMAMADVSSPVLGLFGKDAACAHADDAVMVVVLPCPVLKERNHLHTRAHRHTHTHTHTHSRADIALLSKITHIACAHTHTCVSAHQYALSVRRGAAT